jgi:alpha-galactosidase
VVVDALDAEATLDLRMEFELAPSGLLRTRATLTNHGDDFAVDDLVLALPVPAHATQILDFAGRWGMERLAQARDFTVGTHLREGRKGRTGADAATVLHATEPGTGFDRGEAWGVHLGWSGNHTHYAERVFTDHRVLGGGELLLPGEVILGASEAYTTPWLYGSYGDGLDAVARRFHDFLRARPEHPSSPRPVLLNVWEAVYFDHDLDRLRSLADHAAAVGIERFVLDDGWFGSRRNARSGLGDWVVAPDVWPDGMHPLVEHVRGLGMEFGLWVEPEMVNPDSDVARAHPEWIMAARQGLPLAARNQQVLNLGIPAAYDHVLGQLLALLAEYDIAYLKWDHNRDLVEAGTQTDGGRPGVHEQTLATYRMMDELRSRHPGLEIESCSSGGARVDLGILEHTDRVWASDCSDPLERQRLMRWTGQLIPPELIGAHIASPHSHTTGRRHDLSFRAITAMFGHLGVEWDISGATATERDELAAWIALYKEHRQLLLTGDVVRGPDPADALWVHGVVARDRREAVFALATLAWTPAMPGPRVRIRGLDPQLTYRVQPLGVGIGTPPSGFAAPDWWKAAPELSGAVLGRVGLAAPSLHPEQAVLLRFVAAS